MLPAWLGAGAAIQKIMDEGKGHIIEEMCKAWPFFSTRVGMLEWCSVKPILGFLSNMITT